MIVRPGRETSKFILVQTNVVDVWPSRIFKDGHKPTLIAAQQRALVYRVEAR